VAGSEQEGEPEVITLEPEERAARPSLSGLKATGSVARAWEKLAQHKTFTPVEPKPKSAGKPTQEPPGGREPLIRAKVQETKETKETPVKTKEEVPRSRAKEEVPRSRAKEETPRSRSRRKGSRPKSRDTKDPRPKEAEAPEKTRKRSRSRTRKPDSDSDESIPLVVIIGEYFQVHHADPEDTLASFILAEVPPVRRKTDQAHRHYWNGKLLMARHLIETLGNLATRYPSDSKEHVFEIKVKPIEETAGMIEDALQASDLNTPGKAVLDTGASESVATPQALQALLDSLSKNGQPATYTVETRVEVTFRLADGTLKKPYSRVVVSTPRFGDISFYVLEGCHAPLLVSIKEMRKRGMVIDFQTNTALMSNTSGDMIPIPLEVNARGHLLLDLTR
jgi:hypothetical protein